MSRPSVAVKLIACSVCNKSFTPKYNWGQEKYCSNNCKHTAALIRSQLTRQAKTRTCAHCGQAFVGRQASQKWCSHFCSGKGELPERACNRCGDAFTPKHRGQQHCSRQCRQNVGFITKKCSKCGAEFGGGGASNLNDRCASCRVKAQTSTCVECGREFVRPNSPRDSHKYCSHFCYIRGRFGPLREKAVPEERRCTVCQRIVLRGSGAKRCSAECDVLHQKALHAEKMSERRHVCDKCGNEFAGRKQRYCQHCQTDHNREVMRATRNARKAVKKGARKNGFGRTITLQRLIARDGPMCAICGKPTDYAAHHLTDEYPSIDHVVPLSHGGDHSWTNIRVAHRGCNSFRGDRPSGPIQTALPMVMEIRGAFGTIIMTPVATEKRRRR